MKHIALNIEPALLQEKTGIGKVAYEVSLRMSQKKGVILETFYSSQERFDRAKQLYPKDTAFYFCKRFGGKVYQKSRWMIPIPYWYFFKEPTNARIFFNYKIPLGVKGKKITFIYDMVIRAFPQTMNWKTKLVMKLTLRSTVRRADHFFTISQFSKNEIVKYLDVPSTDISVIPLGVDHAEFHTQYEASDVERVLVQYAINSPYFLYVGTLEPRKNVETLLDAYALLHSSQLECPNLVIVGGKGWKYESIFERVSKYQLEQKVQFTGYVEDGQIPLIMQKATAFVFPSLYEGFGLPVLEAMACGAPVIVSSAASLPEVVGDCGILINPHSAREIADAMKLLMGNAQMREQYREKGLARARQFTWDASVRVMEDTLQRLFYAG